MIINTNKTARKVSFHYIGVVKMIEKILAVGSLANKLVLT